MEYKACTEGVAVMDLTSLGLFEIEVQQADIVTKRRTFLCSVMSSLSNKSKILLHGKT